MSTFASRKTIYIFHGIQILIRPRTLPVRYVLQFYYVSRTRYDSKTEHCVAILLGLFLI